MSLNKTLDRLFDEVRREAKRNAEFADRLDAVLRAHVSRRDVDDLDADAEPERAPDCLAEESAASQTDATAVQAPAPVDGAASALALNPAGFYKREGEAALMEALAQLSADDLIALVAEHNLDPSGAAAGLDRAGVAAYILVQARRRAERDDRMFDY